LHLSRLSKGRLQEKRVDDFQTLITFHRFGKTSTGKKKWIAREKLHKIHLSFDISRKVYEELCSFENGVLS
jgi:hypothetical protein